MIYCSKEDLFESCLQDAIEMWASDSPNEDPQKISSRISSALTRASEEINLYISKQYVLPLPFIPLSLRDICVKISLYQLLSRKGFAPESADSSIKINYDTAIKQLEQIAYGKLDIGVKKMSPTPKTQTVFSFPASRMLKRG